MAIPEDGIGVEFLGGVEPEHVPHLPVAGPILVHIGLYQVRLPAPVPQELEVQLIPLRPRPVLRAHLPISTA